MFEREIRDLGSVPRWVTARHIHKQSVALHSYYVAIYADQIATHCSVLCDRAALLRYALWHDADEGFTGDMPGPVKRQTMDQDKIHSFIATHLKKRFPSEEWVKPKDILICQIVKVADCIDAILWNAAERQLGNMSLRPYRDNDWRNLKTALSKMTILTSDQRRDLIAAVVQAEDTQLYSSSKAIVDE